MTKHTRYDIVIIGGGPAGATLARLLNFEKFKVLLVDGSKDEAKVCGGLLSGAAQDVFAKYDIILPNEVLVSPQIFSVKTVDLADGYTRYYRRTYVNMDRKKFDDYLKSMIPSKTEQIFAKCKNIRKEENGYVLLLSDGEKETEIFCNTLVGADGANSIVRKKLFKNKKAEKYTAIQQVFEAENEKPFYACIFDKKTSPSCSWIFFKDGKMSFGGAFASFKSREAFEKQKQKLVQYGLVKESVISAPIHTSACLVSRPRFFKKLCLGGDNAFLIGEAAELISADSFEGISHAFRSAYALADVLNANYVGKKALRKYKKKLLPLRIKVKLRCIKRLFMWNPLLRRLVMKSKITAIDVYEN